MSVAAAVVVAVAAAVAAAVSVAVGVAVGVASHIDGEVKSSQARFPYLTQNKFFRGSCSKTQFCAK